jgi:ribosomal protein S20
MPNTKSAKKALRRSLFLRERNLKFKLAMKDVVRRFRKLVKE